MNVKGMRNIFSAHAHTYSGDTPNKILAAEKQSSKKPIYYGGRKLRSWSTKGRFVTLGRDAYQTYHMFMRIAILLLNYVRHDRM